MRYFIFVLILLVQCRLGFINAFCNPPSSSLSLSRYMSKSCTKDSSFLPNKMKMMTMTESNNNNNSNNAEQKQQQQQNQQQQEEEEEEQSSNLSNDSLFIPMSFDEMVREVSKCMLDAKEMGIYRQIIRILLPRDPASEQIGQYFESDANLDTSDLILVPPDETWQGGIMQLYRAASPTCQEILRRISPGVGGVPPKLLEDRSLDESGVDGIGLWMTESSTPANDVSCFVQPSQETIDGIEIISSQAGSQRLVALLNPQWRNVDDALDSASKGGGIFGNVASFLGGKGNSLKRLDAMGYQNVFAIEGYVCKGGNIRLVKRFDSDWVIFAENDSSTGYVRVGTSSTRPTYQDVDAMLDAMGISLKYARDIGLAPKL